MTTPEAMILGAIGGAVLLAFGLVLDPVARYRAWRRRREQRRDPTTAADIARIALEEENRRLAALDRLVLHQVANRPLDDVETLDITTVEDLARGEKRWLYPNGEQRVVAIENTDECNTGGQHVFDPVEGFCVNCGKTKR